MTDEIDHDGLYRLAEEQAGYFTAGQAVAAGMDRTTLRHQRTIVDALDAGTQSERVKLAIRQALWK